MVTSEQGEGAAKWANALDLPANYEDVVMLNLRGTELTLLALYREAAQIVHTMNDTKSSMRENSASQRYTGSLSVELLFPTPASTPHALAAEAQGIYTGTLHIRYGYWTVFTGRDGRHVSRRHRFKAAAKTEQIGFRRSTSTFGHYTLQGMLKDRNFRPMQWEIEWLEANLTRLEAIRRAARYATTQRDTYLHILAIFREQGIPMDVSTDEWVHDFTHDDIDDATQASNA